MSNVYGQCARCGGSLTADHKCSVFSTGAVFGTCEHGQLKRSCNICESEATIAALRATVKEQKALLDECEKWMIDARGNVLAPTEHLDRGSSGVAALRLIQSSVKIFAKLKNRGA